MTKIRYYIKTVYGNDDHLYRAFLYAVDYAEEIQSLTGVLTLTERTMKALIAMGFVFEEVLAPKEEVLAPEVLAPKGQ